VTDHSLQDRARQLLDENSIRNRGYYYVAPSKKKYPHQFSWDSAFHAITNCHLGRVELAREEILTLLGNILPDGGLPHLTFHDPSRASLIIRLFRRSIWPYPYRSSLVQPPVVALAVREIWQRGEDAGFLNEALPSLERHFEWLATARTISNSVLVSIFSPWESGQDHKPGFDRLWGVFAKIPLGLYPALYLAEMAMSCRRYDPQQIIKGGWFNVREVLFNTVYALGLEALATMFSATGDRAKAECFRSRSECVEKAILEECYDPASGLYFDVDARTGELIREPSISCLLPVALRTIPAPRLEALIAHLTNPDEFWLPYPVPSLPKNSRYFTPADHRYLWRGPTWINTNWLISEGLRRHGRPDLADEIARKSRELVQRSGFREYYNPITGEGEGEKDFSWSALAAIM